MISLPLPDSKREKNPGNYEDDEPAFLKINIYPKVLKKGEFNYKLLHNQNKIQGSNVPLHIENAHTPAMVKHCLKQSISLLIS